MNQRKKYSLQLRKRALHLGERTLVMGVLNVTPDSFSDGGKYYSLEKAVAGALAMERAGADILDIGGESTRPGADGTTAAEEIARVLPILEALRGRLKIPISIDTQKARVAEIALGAGAEIVNDISGLKNGPELAEVAARRKAPIILMHMRGNPRTMQNGPFAKDVVKDVVKGLRESVEKARKAGIANAQIVIDPGIGFGKSYAQNYELLAKCRTGKSWVSPAGGHIAEGIYRVDACARGKTTVRRRAYLGDSGHRGCERSEWRAYRPRARCCRDGPSG